FLPLYPLSPFDMTEALCSLCHDDAPGSGTNGMPQHLSEPFSPEEAGKIETLRAIMRRLRTPGSGCPWDLEQTFATIAPYTIEEAYEVADAIERGNLEDLCEELGDLLLQVVFHAQMAEEAGAFRFEDVVRGISEKMVRRHPHVFGNKPVEGSEGVRGLWEKLKADERAARDGSKTESGALDGVPPALPALKRAQKLQTRAARVGFDWPDVRPVFQEIAGGTGELRSELDAGSDAGRLAHELGDILFSVVNLARHLGVDAEAALQAANGRFTRRFSGVEQ